MRHLVIILTILWLSPITHAATFTVNTGSDLATDNCTGGACSLRGAILAANATPAADEIQFNIPQSDTGFQTATQHWRIDLTDAGPLLSPGASVTIDGFSQPGAVANSSTPVQGGLNSTLKIDRKSVV